MDWSDDIAIWYDVDNKHHLYMIDWIIPAINSEYSQPEQYGN